MAKKRPADKTKPAADESRAAGDEKATNADRTKPSVDEPKAKTPASAEDLEAAAFCIANVTGQGIIPSRLRAQRTDPTKVAQLAECHRKKNYRPAVQLLYR